jgi:hypothetical protein
MHKQWDGWRTWSNSSDVQLETDAVESLAVLANCNLTLMIDSAKDTCDIRNTILRARHHPVSRRSAPTFIPVCRALTRAMLLERNMIRARQLKGKDKHRERELYRHSGPSQAHHCPAENTEKTLSDSVGMSSNAGNSQPQENIMVIPKPNITGPTMDKAIDDILWLARRLLEFSFARNGGLVLI